MVRVCGALWLFGWPASGPHPFRPTPVAAQSRQTALTALHQTVLPGLPVVDPLFRVSAESGPAIVLAPANRVLVALDPAGEPLWRAPLGWLPVLPPLPLFDGGFFLLGGDGSMTRVSARGETRPLPRGPVSGPRAATVDALGILTVAGMELAQYSPSGAILWRRAVRAAAGPVLVGERNWIVDGEQRLVALNRAGAAVVIERLPDRAHLLAGNLRRAWVTTVGGGGNRLHAYRADGTLLWRTALAQEARRLIPIGAEHLIVATAEGAVLSVDARGQTRWRFDPVGARVTAVEATEWVVALMESDRYVTLLNGQGEVAARIEIGKPVARVALQERTVLIVAEDWSFYLYRLPPELFAVALPPAELVVPAPRPPARLEPTPLSVYAANILSDRSVTARERLLELITQRFVNQRLAGELETVRQVLAALATEHESQPLREGVTVVNDFPPIRIAAVTLLGRLSDAGALATLRGVAGRDHNAAVSAAALQQLSRFGWLPDDEVLRTAGVRLAATAAADREHYAAALLSLATALRSAYPDTVREILRAVLMYARDSETRRLAAELLATLP